MLLRYLTWFAGTGLRASFNSENNNQKKGSIFYGKLLSWLSATYGLTQQTIGTVAHAIEISGKNLLIISFFIGFLGTTKAISDLKF